MENSAKGGAELYGLQRNYFSKPVSGETKAYVRYNIMQIYRIRMIKPDVYVVLRDGTLLRSLAAADVQ